MNLNFYSKRSLLRIYAEVNETLSKLSFQRMLLYLMFITAVYVFVPYKGVKYFFRSSLCGLQFLEYTGGTNPFIAEADSLKMIRSHHVLILMLSLVSASRLLGKHLIKGRYRETKRAWGGGRVFVPLFPKRNYITRLFPRDDLT